MNRLTQELARLCGQRLLDPKWLIAPTLRIGQQWLTAIARQDQPLINVQVKTLRGLALELAGPRLALAASGQGGEGKGGEVRLKAIIDGLAPVLTSGLEPTRLLIWVLALSLTCALEGSAEAVPAEGRAAANERHILTLLEGGAFLDPA